MLRTAFLTLALTGAPALAQSASTKAPSAPPQAAPRSAPYTGKTTLSGVYTLDEAAAGKELFSALCSSCHPIAQHSTPIFRAKWAGRPLSDLYSYIKASMPKSDPGSLADEDYGILVAFVLQANQMPAGKAYLSTDTLELRKIRFDTARTVGKK